MIINYIHGQSWIVHNKSILCWSAGYFPSMLQAIDKDLRTHLHVIVYLQIYEYTYYIDILNIYTYMNIYIYDYIYILVAPALSTLERLFRLGIRVPACEQMAIRHIYMYISIYIYTFIIHIQYILSDDFHGFSLFDLRSPLNLATNPRT